MFTAEDSRGNLVEAEQARRGVAHYCPACRDSVLCRYGSIRRPHFAHVPGIPVLRRMGSDRAETTQVGVPAVAPA